MDKNCVAPVFLMGAGYPEPCPSLYYLSLVQMAISSNDPCGERGGFRPAAPSFFDQQIGYPLRMLE